MSTDLGADPAVLTKLRACRAALAAAVVALEASGGCIDRDCEFEDCWIGALPGDGDVRREAENAIRFITEDHDDGD